MVLEDHPDDDGVADAIADAPQEAELERIAEVEEAEREGVLANLSMSSKTSQESATESAGETHRIQAVQKCVSTHKCFRMRPRSKSFPTKTFCQNILELLDYKIDCIFLG